MELKEFIDKINLIVKEDNNLKKLRTIYKLTSDIHSLPYPTREAFIKKISDYKDVQAQSNEHIELLEEILKKLNK